METPARQQGDVQNFTPQKRSVTACQRCRDQKVTTPRLMVYRNPPLNLNHCTSLNAVANVPYVLGASDSTITVSTQALRIVEGGEFNGAPGEGIVQRHTVINPDNDSTSTPPSSSRPNNITSSSYHAAHYGHTSSPNGTQTGEEGARVGNATPHGITRPSYLANSLESINDSSQSYPNHLRNMNSAREDSSSNVDQPTLPPRALGLSLLEIYYTRIYNASLLFYKPLLFQQYLDGKLPGFLLKALFALATLFLSSPCEDQNDDPMENPELKLLSAYASRGLPWAKSALGEVTLLIFDEPSLTIIQTLHCLQLYWFGVGKPQPGNLCLALAYRSCHFLRYNKKLISGVEKSDISLESELKRRSFWACWVSTCIVMEPEPFIRFAWEEVAMLPLPAHLSSTPSGYEAILDEKMDHTWRSVFIEPHDGIFPFPRANALFVKMVGVWAKAQLLVRDSSNPTAQTLNSMQELSHIATLIFDTPIFSGGQTNPNDTSLEDKPLVLFYHALYHQSQITLHSMIVPLFSGTHIEPAMDPESVKKSAETVMHHAEMFEKLLAPYLYGKGDATELAPFVGYGAFITGIILLATEWEKLHAALQANSFSYRNQCPPTAIPSTPSATHAIRTLDANPSEQKLLLTGSAQGELMRPSHKLLHPWPSSQSALQANIMPQNPSAAGDHGYGFDQTAVQSSNVAVEAQPDITQDEAWYNLYFAEAGIEQFAGFQPLPFFHQEWSIFS
ncbi:hypothetical protein BBP40_011959 [Aspergillus hancockii]|nr:hypothetical protein BBP40_011959 [Aspergillus hancockii]